MRQYIVNLAMKFQGISYRWGGSNPRIGFDCSGYVVWILQVFDLLPSGDWSSGGLYDRLEKIEVPEPGDLVFYGTPISHVMMYIGNGQCIGASGGNSTTTTDEAAATRNAMVKIKPVSYRRDFVSYGKIT